MSEVIDLFAGAGGWDLAARELGIDPLGVEIDEAACATRAAAGLRTLRADVAALSPADFAPCVGVIAPAPCPTFSAAGNRAGALLMAILEAALRDLADGLDTRERWRAEARELLERHAVAAAEAEGKDVERARARARRDADLSMLVVEPLRWALALRPTWVALEQVPEVLPLWKVTAELLRSAGYSVWTSDASVGERAGADAAVRPPLEQRGDMRVEVVWSNRPLVEQGAFDLGEPAEAIA